jgi:hypothetical protein
MAEIATPDLCAALTTSEINDDFEVFLLEDLARAVFREGDGLALFEEEELGRAVGREEGDAGKEGVDGGLGVAATIRAREGMIVRDCKRARGVRREREER